MKKEDWIRHMEAEGLTRPSNGGDRIKWKEVVLYHLKNNCKECKARRKTRRANELRKINESVMKELGLKKVYGPVSGKVYWE